MNARSLNNHQGLEAGDTETNSRHRSPLEDARPISAGRRPGHVSVRVGGVRHEQQARSERSTSTSLVWGLADAFINNSKLSPLCQPEMFEVFPRTPPSGGGKAGPGTS